MLGGLLLLLLLLQLNGLVQLALSSSLAGCRRLGCYSMLPTDLVIVALRGSSDAD